MLDTVIDDPEVTGGQIRPLPPPQLFDSPYGAQLLAAYRELRLLRQRQYADHKLRRGDSMLSKFPRAQAAALGRAGLICVTLLFVLHIGAALVATLQTLQVSELLHMATLAIAIIALAIRALEEGLKPRTEIERYRHYQAAARRLIEQFDEGDTAAKIVAISSLERASFDEMTIFLWAHDEARFIM